MPRIAGVATATPPHPVPQTLVEPFALNLFGNSDRFRRLVPVFQNAKVDTRYFSKSLEWFSEPHTFTEMNDIYIETALELTAEVVTKLARQCEIKTTDFDVIFLISNTGVSTPSLDARLSNRIRLNPHIKRIPIWGLGCAGGAAGLARAHDYLKAYPTHRALIVAVELCSLAFQREDLTKSGIISVALFGDGAAACLMVGDCVPLGSSLHSRPSTIASLSTIYPDTEGVMGWRVTRDGFRVQLSKDIPTIVTTLVKKDIAELLGSLELSLDRIRHFIMHPGGAKVLAAYAAGLGIAVDQLHHSSEVLRNYGNMSSATVFFVLKRYLEEIVEQSNDFGLLGSLGPGFSSEILLIQWK